LLQFKSVCTEKPESLPPLDAIGLEPTDHPPFAMTGGGSGRRQSSTGLSPAASRQTSVDLGIPGFKPSSSSNLDMSNFAAPTSKTTNEERLSMPTGNPVAEATVCSDLMPFGRPASMMHSVDQGGPGSMGSGCNRSRMDEKWKNTNKVNARENTGTAATVAPEPVQTLEMSANRWTRKLAPLDQDSPELVERKVKALVNKLTMEKFESISDQIITLANKSGKDGRILIQVNKIVFENATNEAAWSEIYARLCRKMMERISPDVQDDGIKNSEGKPITGRQLFRKHLLNRCQEDFERGWAAKNAATTATAAKNTAETIGETKLYSYKHYAAQKANRQGLGLIQFIGELYKLQMLTGRIMHGCIKKLLGNVDNHEEEEIESLCRLLTTVGQLLDNVKARAHMDIYFSRMKELIKSNNVSSRMQFMLQASISSFFRL
jgi:translation initiation factor 4G